MLPMSNSQHLNVLNKPTSSVVGQVTLKYKVVFDSDDLYLEMNMQINLILCIWEEAMIFY